MPPAWGMAILAMMLEIVGALSDESVRVLSEDRIFLSKVFVIGKSARIVSTHAFLEGL